MKDASALAAGDDTRTSLDVSHVEGVRLEFLDESGGGLLVDLGVDVEVEDEEFLVELGGGGGEEQEYVIEAVRGYLLAEEDIVDE